VGEGCKIRRRQTGMICGNTPSVSYCESRHDTTNHPEGSSPTGYGNRSCCYQPVYHHGLSRPWVQKGRSTGFLRRTASKCSSRRRPDHDHPFDGDYHGFDDSDSARGRRNPRSGTIVRHCPRHDPRARSGDHRGLRAADRCWHHRQRYCLVPPQPLRRRRRSLPTVPRLARRRCHRRWRHRCHPLRRNQGTSRH
jgi:hypothetical protein